MRIEGEDDKNLPILKRNNSSYDKLFETGEDSDEGWQRR